MEEPDIREVYDMDKDYKLLSWKIPHLKMFIKLGDKFIVDGEEKTLTEMKYANDQLGIYQMYPHLDGKFHTLYQFVKLMEKNEQPQLKTSEEWYNHDGDIALIVMDPDGWDRTNYQYSFYEEKITHAEYMNRVLHSTCLRTTKK